jgi:hypothetical protein
MTCIYSDLDGKCGMWSEDIDDGLLGTNAEGYCVCEEDPDPLETCESYESGDEEEEDDMFGA